MKMSHLFVLVIVVLFALFVAKSCVREDKLYPGPMPEELKESAKPSGLRAFIFLFFCYSNVKH